MPAGVKATSSPLQVSVAFNITNNFQSLERDLSLNTLDREVFVVQAIDFELDTDFAKFQCTAFGLPSGIDMSVSSTSRTSVGTIGDTNVMGTANYVMSSTTDKGALAVQYHDTYVEQMSGNTPPADLDYIGIIATSNFHINCKKEQNLIADQRGSVRIFGYRAQVDANTYAALVQSEVLSA